MATKTLLICLKTKVSTKSNYLNGHEPQSSNKGVLQSAPLWVLRPVAAGDSSVVVTAAPLVALRPDGESIMRSVGSSAFLDFVSFFRYVSI